MGMSEITNGQKDGKDKGRAGRKITPFLKRGKNKLCVGHNDYQCAHELKKWKK